MWDREGVDAQFSIMDLNGDGVIDLSEYADPKVPISATSSRYLIKRIQVGMFCWIERSSIDGSLCIEGICWIRI